MNNISYISEHPQYPLSLIDIDNRPEYCFEDLQLNKSVLVVFLTDKALLDVNRQVLDHDYYTDIITFDYSKDDDIEESEILISIDRVKENAETYGTGISEELHRVIIHGLLHLGGYNDKTSEEQKKMRSMEDHYLDLQRST